MADKQEHKVDWLDEHLRATKRLYSIVYEIENLATAFNATGNIIMCKTLSSISKDISRSAKDADAAVTKSISESIKAAEESSKNILKAALAGVKITK